MASQQRKQQLQARLQASNSGSQSTGASGGCLKEAAQRAAKEAVEAHMTGMNDAIARLTERQEAINARLQELIGLIDRQGDEAALTRRRIEAHTSACDALFEDTRAKVTALETRLEDLAGDTAILSEIVTSS